MPVLEKKPTSDAALPEEGKKAAKAHGKLPEKRTINLATVNQKKINWLLALPLILVIVVAAAAFAKFGVMDQFEKADAAEREVTNLETQLAMYNAKIASFGEINDVYAHYTYNDMTSEELSREDRVAMMDLIERVVTPNTPPDGWRVTGNQMIIDINGRTLQEINLVVQLLLEEDIVDFCNVNTAKTIENRENRPTAPTVPTVPAEPADGTAPAEGTEGTTPEAPAAGEPAADTVSANVIVQFKGRTQEEP